MKRWYRFRGLLLLVVAEMERTDRQTHTHTQDNYCNPRCACTLRVNYPLFALVLSLLSVLIEEAFI